MSKKNSEVSATKMDKFPGLKDMGVNNPSEISRYSLREEEDEDVLRIYYKRARGSLLPSSRKYSFGRARKTIITDSGKPQYAEDPQISNVLQQVLKELDAILRNSNDHDVLKASIIDEIDHLDRYVSSKIRELRSQIEQL